MKYALDEKSGKSAYIQLYEQIKRDIIAGFYAYSQRLPSKRVMADDTHVSVITVAHAYGLLCDEGYVQGKERSGFYVIYKKSDFLYSTPSAQRDTVKNAALPAKKGEFPFSLLAKKMRKVIADYGERILVKSPNSGCFELQNAISLYLARNIGIVASPEQIIIGSGAEYLYGITVQLLHETLYALEKPSYERIARVYTANSVMCDFLTLGADGILTEELERTRAKVLHVTPFNSFPSGISADASKRREYIEWAKRRDAYIVEDNYDSELTVSKRFAETLYSMDDCGRVIYMNTFSNTIAPSLRIGYMVLPDKLLSRFKAELGFYSCTVPVFDQYVIAELLQSGDFERHINRVRRERRKELL